MDRVSKRSYALLDNWINTGPFAPADIRSPEAERLRQLLDFSKAAKERVYQHHERAMGRSFSRVPRSLHQWSRPFNTGSGTSETASAYCVAYDSQPCAYDFIHELVSMNIAATELFQAKRRICWSKAIVSEEESRRTSWQCYPVYQFGTDYQTASGGVEVEAGGGSSFGQEMSSYLFGSFEKDYEGGGDEWFVGTSVMPCSKRHFMHLLQRPSTLSLFVVMFGECVFVFSQ
jgi:hypothetical protein